MKFLTVKTAFLCVLLGFTTAQASGGAHFQVTTVAPDLLMLSTDQGSYSNNSLVFTGQDGVLLVDTHHRDDSEALERFVKDLGLGKPAYVINTHRHVEHIGGNHLFGGDAVIIAHALFPEKLQEGKYLFAEYPADALPDITFDKSLELNFNGELIRLTCIGGSHDDNEIMVHFTRHGVAHVSSVVNGFNFPSVDSDGDALQFEAKTRQLMELLPRGTRLVSGHNGNATGFDFVGEWDQLEPYANMLRDTVAIVRDGLARGMSGEDLARADALEAFTGYAGSYVTTDNWIDYLVSALTGPPEVSEDVFKPVYAAWKNEGAEAAVKHYRKLLETKPERYDPEPYTLLAIGSELLANGHDADALVFLLGSRATYPDSEYAYYTHFLAAKALQRLGRVQEAMAQARISLGLNSGFQRARELLDALQGSQQESPTG